MKKRDIICISMTTWEGDYMKTIVHMMSQLAKNHRVLFVDYAFTWKDVVFTLLGKSKAPLGRMLNLRPRLRRLKTRQGDEIHHLTLPPVIPINWIKSAKIFDFFLRIQSVSVIAALRNAINKLGYHQPVIINAFHPAMGEALNGKLDESAVLYYCYDEIRAAQWAGLHGGRLEDTFIQKVEQVIVTSQALFEDRSTKHKNVTLVKNGVDFELFHQAYKDDLRNERPVIGYIGSIDDRFDHALVASVADEHPDWDIHLVGRITSSAAEKALSTFENVTFFGAQQPDQIPAFLSSFDVGMIPFVSNEFTRNIYPLKINEYLAAGKPVVSTKFADLSDFTELVHLTKDAFSFNQLLKKSLLSNDAAYKARALDMARSNGWEHRALQVEEILENLEVKHHSYA